jgi:hypothetical protein
MKPYTTTTEEHFVSYKRYNVDDLDLSKYAHVVSTFKDLGAMLGVSCEECIEACKVLKIRNSDLIDIDYSPPGSSWGTLLEDNAARRRVREKKSDQCRIDNYSSYVITHQYASVVEAGIVRYFLEKKYPHIFLHPEFFHKKWVEVCLGELSLSEFIEEHGDMTFKEAKQKATELAATKREVTKSKFKMYAIHSVDSYEIYLETGLGSLYVPLKSIEEKDFSLIENRMRSYFSCYYKDKPEKQKEALSPLDSPEAALLKQLLLI